MAAPIFVSRSALTVGNSGTTLTTVIPAEQADDIAVLSVHSSGSQTFSTPTDWTQLGTPLESDAGMSSDFFWKRMTGSDADPATTTGTTQSNTLTSYSAVWLFRGCITTGDPFEGVGNDGTAAQTTPDSTACTTTDIDRLVCCLCHLDNNTAWASGMPPSGWTNMGGYSSTATGANGAIDAINRTEASATTVPTAVVGTLGASIRWRTITFALIPAAADLTPIVPVMAPMVPPL